jgi:ABC-2 type transport system ATP-binding protein
MNIASNHTTHPLNLLTLGGVCKSFGTNQALDNISLTLADGEIYALLGPNGAGKTTTLNLILGFITPDSGQIEVAGISVIQDPLLARSKIAYLPETVMLHPALSAVENLRYFALLGGRQLTPIQASSLLAETGLAEVARGSPASTFSKGMRQKVGLAIALAKEAKLLLLDEPTSGLDASAANDFSQLVHSASSHGMAVLMATHDLYRVKDVAHRLGVLHAGKLVFECATAALSSAEIESLYLREIAA